MTETYNPPPQSLTLRPTVPAIESILGHPFQALDSGFVRVVDYLGGDNAIVQAARVSYGSGTKTVSEDRGLIRYLLRHAHTTPFEMCEIKLHCKMPIFVARQWIRHRTANVNEYSARYSRLDKEFYIPKPEHLAAQSTSNKQGRGNVLSESEAATVLTLLMEDANRAYDSYEYMINENEDGTIKNPERSQLARELARMNLSLNYFTQWYWKIDLHNLLHFLSLRADSHAQYEIRVFADIILNQIVKRWVPMAYEAFVDYDHRQGGAKLSRMEVAYLRKIFAEAEKLIGPDNNKLLMVASLKQEGCTQREADEFVKKFTSGVSQ